MTQKSPDNQEQEHLNAKQPYQLPISVQLQKKGENEDELIIIGKRPSANEDGIILRSMQTKQREQRANKKSISKLKIVQKMKSPQISLKDSTTKIMVNKQLPLEQSKKNNGRMNHKSTKLLNPLQKFSSAQHKQLILPLKTFRSKSFGNKYKIPLKSSIDFLESKKTQNFINSPILKKQNGSTFTVFARSPLIKIDETQDIDFQKLESLLITDMAFLRRFPQIDLQIWVMKIKKEQYQRKISNLLKWSTFKYQNIPSDKIFQKIKECK